jgi:hypothetical protein
MFVSKISAALATALFCLASPAVMAADGVAKRADKATLLKIKQPVNNLINGLVFSFYIDYSKLDGPLELYANTTSFKVRPRGRHETSFLCFISLSLNAHFITFTLILTTNKTHTCTRLHSMRNPFTRTPTEPTRSETHYITFRSSTKSSGRLGARRAITSRCRMCPCSTRRGTSRYVRLAQVMPSSLLHSFPITHNLAWTAQFQLLYDIANLFMPFQLPPLSRPSSNPLSIPPSLALD